MSESLSTNPEFVDWKNTFKNYRNEQVARVILSIFAQDLPKLQSQMHKEYGKKRFKNLAQTIHQIHGACCFCMCPPLEKYSKQLEKKLRQKNYTDLKKNINKLDMMIHEVLEIIEPYIEEQPDKEEK